MTSISYALVDSATMLRRQLRHMLRYPIGLMLVGVPVVFLLLFVYVPAGPSGDGPGGLEGGRADYVNCVAPAIIVLTVPAWSRGRRSPWTWT